MTLRIILFLFFNFGALALGGLFTSTGVSSDWYQSLNKAPWTPRGCAFGAAWTLIMLCFSVYMALLWPKIENKTLLSSLYLLQLVLNIAWNPIFFHFHHTLIGLIVISGLTVLMAYFFIGFLSEMKIKSLLILPYFLWLLIATSLNAYIWKYNM